MSALAPHAWGELVTLAAVILAVSVAILGGFRLGWKTAPADRARAARERTHGPRAFRRPAPVVLSPAERAAFRVLARSVEGQPWREVYAAVAADYPPERAEGER